MKSIAALYCLLLFASISTVAFAQSARFGSRLVSVGDPVERLRDAAGSPETVQTASVAGEPEIWTYRRKGRLIQMWISAGRVERVIDRRADAEGV
ncbi:MAG: hypothetical protein ABI411_18775 [Tahibacter sp.]